MASFASTAMPRVSLRRTLRPLLGSGVGKLLWASPRDRARCSAHLARPRLMIYPRGDGSRFPYPLPYQLPPLCCAATLRRELRPQLASALEARGTARLLSSAIPSRHAARPSVFVCRCQARTLSRLPLPRPSLRLRRPAPLQTRRA